MHHRNGTERGGWARVGRALVYLPAVYLLLALLAHGVPGEVYRQAAGQDLAGTVFEYEQGSVRYVIQEEAGRPAFLKLGPRGWFLFPQSLCRREAAISFTGPEGGPPPASGWRSIADGFPAQGAEGLFLEDFLTWYEEGDRREGVLHLGVALDRPPDLAGMEVLFLEEWAGTGHVFAAISNTKEQ